MLISQELVPVILGVIQSPETVETKDTCSDETHLQRKQDPHNPTISEHVAVAQRLTGSDPNSFFKSPQDAHISSTKEVKSEILDFELSDKIIEHNPIEESLYLRRSRLFVLSSQHAVKLGETLACILKLNKK